MDIVDPEDGVLNSMLFFLLIKARDYQMNELK